MNCPNEHGEMRKVRSIDRLAFRGISVQFDAEHFICDVCSFTADDLTVAATNQMALSDAYRKAAGLLTGAEIVEGRKKLGWSQEELARAVNVGIASVKRWERGQVQTPVMDKALREVLEGKPLDGNVYTGNRPLSMGRVKLVLKSFSSRLKKDLLKATGRGILYAGKYLWYADMISFRETGRGMTGATYAALPQGPQLNNYAHLLDLIREADEKAEEPLSDHEERIISRIAGACPTNTAIYDACHRESIWEAKRVGELIPYTDAVYLTQLSMMPASPAKHENRAAGKLFSR